MKFKFCKRIFEPDFYNKEKRQDWIIKKKGWFGWKTLNEVYDGNWCTHMSWSYFSTPSACSSYETFKTKKECLLYLKTYYRKIKPKVCC